MKATLKKLYCSPRETNKQKKNRRKKEKKKEETCHLPRIPDEEKTKKSPIGS